MVMWYIEKKQQIMGLKKKGNKTNLWQTFKRIQARYMTCSFVFCRWASQQMGNCILNDIWWIFTLKWNIVRRQGSICGSKCVHLCVDGGMQSSRSKFTAIHIRLGSWIIDCLDVEIQPLYRIWEKWKITTQTKNVKKKINNKYWEKKKS